jgi:beta-glucosidase/6-phospho-beta-glucosidase/beta-galactosidase
LGQFLKHLHHRVGKACFKSPTWQRLINLLYERDEVALDYIAFDFYDPFISHALRWPTWDDFEERPRTIRDWLLESVASKWWDWRLLPEGLAFFVNHLGQYNLPMLIAENGMALRRSADNVQHQRRDSLVRSQYLREHVRVASRLAEQGHQLIGYLHWSLFDNYEWGSFTPRFGLYSLDYTVYPDRQAVDATGDNASATYALEIKEANARLERARRRQLQKQSNANAENLTFGPAPADSESSPSEPFTLQDKTPLE